MTEAAAYGSGDTQICRQSALNRRLRAVQMRCIAERGNKRVVRIVRLGGYVIAPSREPIER